MAGGILYLPPDSHIVVQLFYKSTSISVVTTTKNDNESALRNYVGWIKSLYGNKVAKKDNREVNFLVSFLKIVSDRKSREPRFHSDPIHQIPIHCSS